MTKKITIKLSNRENGLSSAVQEAIDKIIHYYVEEVEERDKWNVQDVLAEFCYVCIGRLHRRQYLNNLSLKKEKKNDE